MADKDDDPETKRIFANESLHRLQVRYPWFCGYAIAPITFMVGQKWYGTHSFTWLSKRHPLLAAPASEDALSATAMGATVLFCGHFLRRAWEVIYVNDYTGT